MSALDPMSPGERYQEKSRCCEKRRPCDITLNHVAETRARRACVKSKRNDGEQNGDAGYQRQDRHTMVGKQVKLRQKTIDSPPAHTDTVHQMDQHTKNAVDE